jgi:sortase B
VGGNINYYRNHPVINFSTLYEDNTYKIFAVVFAHTENTGETDVFDYHRWRDFPDEETFFTFITNVLDRSGFYTDVDIEYGDEILTLSTCYYPLGLEFDSRVAVFARRLRDGESSEVNVDAAYMNPSPLYFDYYYSRYWGRRSNSWAGRNWDTSKVKGLDEWLAKRGDRDLHIRYAVLRDEIASSREIN